jgi:hypothetical protein
MQFHVGPVSYRLVISNRHVFDAEGNELEGVAVEGRRLIILSCIVEPERREEVALHEFTHCWSFHVPIPRDEEERCQLTALIAQQFQKDLDAAGGREALMQMQPVQVPHLGRPLPAVPDVAESSFARPHRMICFQCDTEILCGSIEQGEVFLHEFTGKQRVERWMKCDSCGTLTVWHEVVHPDGSPTGEVCAHPKPRMLRGAEASAWLADRSLQSA